VLALLKDVMMKEMYSHLISHGKREISALPPGDTLPPGDNPIAVNYYYYYYYYISEELQAYFLCVPAGTLTDDLLLQAYHRASRGSAVGWWKEAWKVFLTAKSQNVVLSWDDELLLFAHSRCQVPSQNSDGLHLAVPLVL